MGYDKTTPLLLPSLCGRSVLFFYCIQLHGFSLPPLSLLSTDRDLSTFLLSVLGSSLFNHLLFFNIELCSLPFCIPVFLPLIIVMFSSVQHFVSLRSTSLFLSFQVGMSLRPLWPHYQPGRLRERSHTHTNKHTLCHSLGLGQVNCLHSSMPCRLQFHNYQGNG